MPGRGPRPARTYPERGSADGCGRVTGSRVRTAAPGARRRRRARRRRCGSTRSAIRLVTPSLRSRRPRMTTATRLRAACRCAFITPTEQTTLSMPVSSSRLRKVTPMRRAGPLAVGDQARRRGPGGRTRWWRGRRPSGAGAGELGAQVLDRVPLGRDPGGPEVGEGDLDLAHPRQRRRRGRRGRAGQVARRPRRSRPPTAPRGGRAPSRRRRRRWPAPRAGREVRSARRERSVTSVNGASSRAATIRSATSSPMPRTESSPSRTASRRRGGGRARVGRARHPLGAREPRPAALVEAGGPRPAPTTTGSRSACARGARDVGTAYVDAVAAGVADQRLGGVEAHRLVAQQPGQERRRVVQLEPRRRVDQQREAQRVRLGEAEVGERQDLHVDRVGQLAGDAAPRHARRRASALIDSIRSTPRLEPIARRSRSASSRRAVAEGHRHRHQLLLEQRDAAGALEHRHQVGVVVGDRLLAGGAADVGVHGAALDRARGGSARSRWRGRRTRAAAAAAGCRSGRGSRPGRPRSSRRGRACRRPPAPPWASSRGPTARRGARRPAASCGRARRACRGRAGRTSPAPSTRRRPCPTAARCACPSGARSIGQTSPIGRSVSTMPPEWMPRWRGAPSSSSASATTGAGTSWAAGSPWSPATTDFQPSICLDQASCWPGEWPSALAASRTAIRGR